MPRPSVATVEMTRNEQHVAANAFATRGREPVGPALLDQLDEAVAVGRKVALERLLLVGRIHGDRAHRPDVFRMRERKRRGERERDDERRKTRRHAVA